MSFIQQSLLKEHEISSLLLQYPSFFIAIAAIYFIYLLLKWNLTSEKKNSPPSPPKLPIIGNLHQLGLYPHRSLRSLSQRYGPFMLLQLGKVKVLVVSSADGAREIMKTHDLIFASRPKSAAADKLLYGSRDMAFSPYGEYWKQIRSVCVLHLLNNKRVQSFHDVRGEEILVMTEKIRELASSSLPIDLSKVFVRLTSDIICRAAFGRKYDEGEEGSKFEELLSNFEEMLGGVNVSDYIPWLGWVNYVNGLNAKMEKVAKGLDDFVEGVIRGHEERMVEKGRDYGEEEQTDFLDVLLRLQKDNTRGFLIDRVSMKAIILDMFAGGTDTSHASLEWTMTELLRHPRVLTELQNETRRIADNRPNIEHEDLDRMPYLKAVLKEVLRLHPPIPLLVPRESTQDVKVNGYNIPIKTRIITNAWAIARDPTTWDKPEEFTPERFLDNSIDFKGHDFELVPFGAGRRGCPGILFAMALNELAIANLVYKFDWSLPNGVKVEDLDMTECTGLTIHKKNPLLAIATPFTY